MRRFLLSFVSGAVVMRTASRDRESQRLSKKRMRLRDVQKGGRADDNYKVPRVAAEVNDTRLIAERPCSVSLVTSANLFLRNKKK